MDKIQYAVGYCRFSDDKQREESIEAQKEAITRFAKEHGYVIVRWYIDRGESARTAERRQYKQMIEDSAKRDFRVVLVHKLDRFSREDDGGSTDVKILKANKVKVLSVSEYIPEGADGVLLRNVLIGLNARYSINLANEVRKGMRMNAKKAQINGKPPYGYKRVPRKDKYGELVMTKGGRVVHDIALDPLRAEAVKIMFDMTLAGAGVEDIVRELNAKGYRNSAGKKFITNSLGHFLRNERYTGTYIYDPSKKYREEEGIEESDLDEDSEHRTIRVEGGMPQIVNPDTFNAVQRILNSRKHQPSRHANVDYLLTGKIVCGECGAPFSGSSHTKNGLPYHYYRSCCGHSGRKVFSVRKEPLEDFVINEIEREVKNEEFIVHILDRFVAFYRERNGSSELIGHLRKAEKEVDKKIDNIIDAIAASGNLGDRFQLKLNALENEKAEILASLERENGVNFNEFVTKADIRRTYFKVLNLLQSGNAEDKTAIINTLLNRIIVYKDRVEVFVNMLPLANSTNDLLITDKDLHTYGLLEPIDAKSTAISGAFPSENCFGDPTGNRTRVTAVRGRCLDRLTMGPFLGGD